MIRLRRELVEMLRTMARGGERPSAMLRALVAELGPETGDRPLLVRYVSTAFCFTDGQGYKIFGWFPEGTGALQDSGIDALLGKRIEETRTEWDKAVADESELDSHSESSRARGHSSSWQDGLRDVGASWP